MSTPDADTDGVLPDSACDVVALRRAARRMLPGDTAALEADLLLAHALDRPRSWLFAHGEHGPDDHVRREFQRLLDARRRGVPVAQLTGRRGFWTLDLAVDAHTLIPRPETERLVELALQRLPPGQPLAVADLGTGSGAIALAIASERPDARLIATDQSMDALRVAQANASALGLGNIAFRHGDWCTALDGSERLAMIVSNPPYLADDDPHLQQGDLRFEPRSALASGPDGLDAIRRIVADASAYLRSGGWLLLEHGWQQGAAVRALLEDAGWVDVETATDLEDRDRVSVGRRR